MDYFPRPIASEIRAFEECSQLRERFIHLRHLVSFTFRYVALIALSCYTSENSPPELRNSTSKHIFRGLKHPSLRDCRDILQELAYASKRNSSDLCVPELVSFVLMDDGNASADFRRFDEILDKFESVSEVNLKHDIQYRTLLDQLTPMVVSFLQSLNFLEKYPLVKVTASSRRDNMYLWRLESQTGLRDEAEMFSMLSPKPVQGSITGLWDIERQQFVALHPLIIFEDEEHGDLQSLEEQLLLYERYQDNYVDYVGSGLLHGVPSIVHRSDLVSIVARIIEEVLQPGRGPDFDWDGFVARATRITEAQILNLQSKYIPELYAARHLIEDLVKSFIEGTKSGLILTGPSGMGKTNLLCDLAQGLIKEGHCVFLYNCGGSRLTLGPSLEGELAYDMFGDDPFSLSAHITAANASANKSNKRIIIVFDGVNEFNYAGAQAGELLAQIDAFVNRYSELPAVRVIASCRTIIWEQLDRLGKTNLFWSNYFQPIPGEKTVVVNGFEPEELEVAYRKYHGHYSLNSEFDELSDLTKSRFKDPFLLRLTATLYRGRAIPHDAPTLSVFASYFNDQVMNKWDAVVFLRKMVGEMFAMNADSLSLYEMHVSGKFGEVDSQDLRSTYVRLKDLGILLELGDGWLPRVRFTYDRYLEYLLARDLLAKMTVERLQKEYLLELAQKSRVFPPMWGTLQSMLLLNPVYDWWFVLGASTDYVAREIFVDTVRDYFDEYSQEATELMISLIDEENPYLTRAVLRAAWALGEKALDVFDHAMKSSSKQTRRILVDLLYSVSKSDLQLYFVLFDHFASLMTPRGIAFNRNMAIGGIQNLLNVVAANVQNPDILNRCNQTLHTTIENLHLASFSRNKTVDAALKKITTAVLPIVLRVAALDGVIGVASLDEFQDPNQLFKQNDEKERLVRLFAYTDINKTDFGSCLDDIVYIFEKGALLSKAFTLSILSIQLNTQREEMLALFVDLFNKCSGEGRIWLLTVTFAIYHFPASYPLGYLDLLEELTIRFVHENEELIGGISVPLQKLINSPLLSLCMSYKRENISDMPIVQSLISQAMNDSETEMARNLVASLFPAGIFHPEFILNFIDQHLEVSNKVFTEPLASGLSLLIPMFPEITSSYIERWKFSPEQRDLIYSQVNYSLPYKAYQYITVYNLSVQLFLTNSEFLKKLGRNFYERVATCSSLNEVFVQWSIFALSEFQEINFDLIEGFGSWNGQL